MSCPPGQLCLNNNYILIFVSLLLVSLYIVYNINSYKPSGKELVDKKDDINYLNQLKKNLNINIDIPKQQIDPDYNNIYYKRVVHPLYPPEKTYDPGITIRPTIMPDVVPDVVPDIVPDMPPLPIQTGIRRGRVPGIPINIRTRGGPGEYQQLGVIYNDSMRLPLFGRQTYRGSNQWNYYTYTDSNNSIKLPININKNSCTDERGCPEINNGDSIKVLTYNDEFKAELYSNDGPRYIPYVY